MKSISISRAKIWKECKLNYNYLYENKFTPKDKQPIFVTVKGTVLHETFEHLLKFENYVNENSQLPYRVVDWNYASSVLIDAIKRNQLPRKEVEEFNLPLGLKRWLSFKHDYLDKTGHVLYAEKQYNEVLFGETKTITILDLLEDCGDGTYNIYDYKTPKTTDTSRYKEQLTLYAYVMACVKGIIQPGSTEYEKVVQHFRLFIFFPLVEGDFETYQGCLKQCKFTAKDVQNVIEQLQKTCSEIDAFNFNVPAEVLQPVKLPFQCRWCDYYGAKPQMDIHSEKGQPFYGCPITAFMNNTPRNTEFIPTPARTYST